MQHPARVRPKPVTEEKAVKKTEAKAEEQPVKQAKPRKKRKAAPRHA